MASHKLFSAIFALLLVFGVHGGVANPNGCYINAIYSLGDSLADTGNLLRLGLDGSFNVIASLPYGQTIHKPTGRCSDGLLMIDFLGIASFLFCINLSCFHFSASSSWMIYLVIVLDPTV